MTKTPSNESQLEIREIQRTGRARVGLGQLIDRAGCLARITIAGIWAAVLADIHLIRHLEGTARLMDFSTAVILTLGILTLLPTSDQENT